MANYSILKAAIAQVIKNNGNNEITGNLLQQQLFSMVNTLGTGYQCMGVAVLTPTPTNPGTPDANVFYIASEPGTYANFGNIVINDGEVCLLTYNGTWSKRVTGAATASQLNQLGQEVSAIESQTRELVKELVGFTINSSGLWMQGENYNCFYIKVNPSDSLVITPASVSVPSYYTILSSEPNPVNGGTPNYATGYSALASAAYTRVVEIPGDGRYVVFLRNAGQTIYTPSKLEINGVNVLDSLQGELEKMSIPVSWAKEVSPFIKKQKNLFNKNAADITYGAYIQGGNLNVDSGYNVSGYIPVSDYLQYSHLVYSYFGTTANRVSCYDKDKNYLGHALGVVTDGINTFTPLAWTSFVRVNVVVGDMDSYMFVDGAEYPTAYIPFGIKLENADVSLFSPLYGKKLCCDGDSIMHGAAQGGVSNGGFAKPIADRFGMVLQNIAVPGGTIRSNTYWDADQQNPRHWICDSLATLDADGDYYIFEGGVNDVGSSAVMGTISWGYTANLDTTTFCGAMEKCCKTLVENFKGKKYGFVFVHRIWQPADTLASTFFDNQKAILKKWGIPYIDLMEDVPSLNLIDSLKDIYTSNQDGWHPNALGYAKYYVDKIVAFMESL